MINSNNPMYRRSNIIKLNRLSNNVNQKTPLNKKLTNTNCIIYSSNYGHYDAVNPALNCGPNIRYIMFCDFIPQKNYNGWEIRDFNNFPECVNTPILKSKYIKMFPYIVMPDITWPTIWVDSSYQIISKKFVSTILPYLTNNGIAIYKHQKRNNILDELDRLLTYSKYNNLNIKEQVYSYIDDGFPSNYGLWAGGLISRLKCDNSEKICQLWWDEIIKWTYRDQLSLPYILWKNNLKIDTIFLRQYTGDLFRIKEHISKK